ncbi:uncharacterized protein LOC127861289 [Dreissena polymorpha]|uniref:uncharacterized protein LOC127861289 n=1 Tax=Dreissena polymorpha TaxID=45954 RepID=UPI0022645BD6|nr:uncharacterized protein LOC127861289 [Dreissena polymorpha]
MFSWGPCERIDNIPIMCSTGPYTGSNTTAETFNFSSTGANYTWSAANSICLKLNYHPASIASIINSKFGNQQKQYYWTGITRSTAIIKSTSADILTNHLVQQFAFLKNGSCALQFAGNDVIKRALCIQATETISTSFTPHVTKSTVISTDFPTTEISKSPYSTDNASSHVVSSTGESIPREFPVIVGIGVAVGIMLVVGAVVVIFVLRRRGVLPCTFGTTTDEPYASTISFANRSNEETVDNHNYVMIDTRTQSVEYINVQSHTERAYENK